MNTIIAAIAVGVVLLWAAILGLIKLVDLYERRHILAMGFFTTLVAGVVLGLVLFTVQERQKEHRREMEQQIQAVTKQLGDLSNRMLAQLEEKADLTASEFQIRANLQHEKADHKRTRGDLAERVSKYEELEQVLARERQTQSQYQEEQNRKIELRFQQEEERYRGLRDYLEEDRRTIRNVQKQLANIQSATGKLTTETASLQSEHNRLLGKVDANRQVQDLAAQKIDALARSLQALHENVAATQTEVDSLYTWQKK